MSSETLHGHGRVLAGLWRAAADTKLAHGLLFDGPEGAGKFFAARRFLRGLYCVDGPGEPCGTCGPCKRVASGAHADLLVLDPEEEGVEQIAVNWIRPRRDDPSPRPQTVEQFLSLKPAEDGWRAVLVRDAERMNVNAQNALLKTLEEPGSATLIVLVSARPDRLLETVRSRTVRVEFRALSLEDTLAVLREHGVPDEEAPALARWAGCAPGRALALHRFGVAHSRELLRAALVGEVGALEASVATWELPGEFRAHTPRAAARLRARVFLDLGLEILADLSRAEAGLDVGELAHGDLVAELRGAGTDATRALRGRRLGRLLDEWLELRQDVEANLAPEGLLDRAFLALDTIRAESRREARPDAPRGLREGDGTRTRRTPAQGGSR